MNVSGMRVLSVPVVLSGCAGLVDVDQDGSGDLIITPSASEYRWDDVDAGLVIEGTLVNRSSRAYYARLGDGFNAASEQEQLFVATGSDAYLERRESSGWVPTQRATLVEGVRVVILRPDTQYALMAYLSGERIIGEFRIRVSHASDEDGYGVVGTSLSNTFEVK